MEPEPKALLFDLDGTLAKSKQPVEPDMGALLGRLLKRLPVAIMSGAGFSQFQKQFLPALPPEAQLTQLYIFPTNAAACYTFSEGVWQPRYENLFSQEERARILRALQEALQTAGLKEPPAQVWGERIEDRGAQISFSGLGQQAPLAAKKEWDPTGEKKRALHDALAPLLPDCTVTMSGSTTVDITRKGINKAYGVRKFAEMTGIPVAHMLYVGDALFPGGNDAVVTETGIPTHAVRGPEESAALVASLVGSPIPALK